MTDLYLVAPVAGWAASGVVKFGVNYCRFGRDAFRLVGNGGFPSTHTTVVSSAAVYIGLRQGFNTPLTGLALAVLIVVMIDAMGLRRAVGHHAALLNRRILAQEQEKPLRERQGHSPIEVAGGLVLGSVLALGLAAC